MIDRGKLIVFEGPDRVGKSTLAQWFARHLQESGNRCTLLSFPGREAGILGRHVYELHHDPARFGIDSLTQLSLQLLHVAAHMDTIETRIKPLVAEGMTVVLDRFWWSTYVYGIVGNVSPSMLDGIITLERSVWDPLQPDRLFVISRSAPLRPESPQLWSQWRDAYGALAEQEMGAYQIVVVPNEAGIKEAQERILRNL